MHSRARYASRRSLPEAWHARRYAEGGAGEQKTKMDPKGKAAKRVTDEAMVRIDDCEVEREVEELMRLEEEDEAEVPEDYGVDEEAVHEAESSAAATRRRPAPRCKQPVTGRVAGSHFQAG